MARAERQCARKIASSAVNPMTGIATVRMPAPQAWAAVISLSWYSRTERQDDGEQQAPRHDGARKFCTDSERDELEHDAARILGFLPARSNTRAT